MSRSWLGARDAEARCHGGCSGEDTEARCHGAGSGRDTEARCHGAGSLRDTEARWHRSNYGDGHGAVLRYDESFDECDDHEYYDYLE